LDSVRDNLLFSLEDFSDSHPPACDFALSPEALAISFGPPFLGPQPECVLEADSYRLLTSLRGHLDMSLGGRRLKLKGLFAVKAEMLCHRCLSPFEAKVGDSFSESLDLSQDEGPDLDGLRLPLRDGRFDLTSLMREFFLIAVPFQVLCRPDCQGLCLSCGANLNLGPCPNCQK
jgi:hypothetical protein